MFDRAALAAFSAVLHAGSFDAAAARLHVTQSAISQRIKTLEDQTGAVLIRRTRPPEPTEAGRHLLRHAERLSAMEAQLARDLTPSAAPDPQPLRIAVTADSLATWVLPALAATPDMLFDLVIDDQDHSADLLRAGDVAGAITASHKPVSGCDVIPLGALSYVAFASPGFVQQHFPTGITPEALHTAPAITFNRKDRLQRAWAEAATGQRVTLPTHYIASTQDITTAAVHGLGWAVNPIELITPHIASGDLVELDPTTRIDTPLFWQLPRVSKEALAPITSALRRVAHRA